MDFSKLKLVTEALGNDLYSQAAKNTSDKAKVGHATAQTSDQSLQTQQKTGVVQPTTRAAAATPVKGVQEYFDTLRHNVDLLKAYDRQRMDWRRDLREDLNIDEDDEDHPYVELMPFKSMKADEAKKLVKQEKEKKKKKPSMNPQDMMGQLGAMAGGDMSGGGGAMPGGMAEETIYETRKDEKGLSGDQKAIKRSYEQGEDPLNDPGAVVRRRTIHEFMRNRKKKGAVKEEAILEANKSDPKKVQAEKQAKQAKKKSDEEKRKRQRFLAKSEKEFKSSNDKASSYAQKAKAANTQAHSALKRGDKAAAKRYYDIARDHAMTAKTLRGNVARKYVPLASKKYSQSNNPIQMNSTYDRDVKTSKGRKEIIKRTYGIADDQQ